MERWLPKQSDKSSRYEVYTKDKVTRSRLKAINCKHEETTYFNFIDTWDSKMRRYYGQACIACGRITEIQEVK